MEDKIKEIVKKEFNADVVEIKRIIEGYSHSMYEVKLGKEPKEVIIRFANNIKEDVNLAKEKFIINLLAKYNIPVPKIYAFYHPDNKKEGYLILEKINGIRLDTIWDSFTKEEKIKVTKKLGELLAKIHKIELESFGYIKEGGKIDSDISFKFRKEGEALTYSPFLRQTIKDSFIDFARLISYKYLPPEFMAEVILYISKNLDAIDYKGKPVLNHGDYMPGHIFVEKDNNEYEIVGLIDFELAHASSPEYDFIKLHRHGFFDDEELKNALREGYGNIRVDAVEMHRLMRDVSFAQVLFESGDKELGNKIIKETKEKIDKKLTSQT